MIKFLIGSRWILCSGVLASLLQLLAGLYYRGGDALIPMVGFEIKQVRFTFSYDATTSALKNYNNLQGASELNITKKGFYEQATGDTRQVLCPRF